MIRGILGINAYSYIVAMHDKCLPLIIPKYNIWLEHEAIKPSKLSFS